MPDLGEEPAFRMIELSASRVGRRRGGQELQRDLTVETRVPRAEYFAERASTHPLEQAEMTPAIRCCRPVVGRRWRRNVLGRQQVAVQLRDGCQYPQLS